MAALAAEIVLTMMFIIVMLGATDERAPKGMARRSNYEGERVRALDQSPARDSRFVYRRIPVSVSGHWRRWNHSLSGRRISRCHCVVIHNWHGQEKVVTTVLHWLKWV